MEINFEIKLAENLKKLRKETNMSQKQVCTELGMHGCWIDRSTYTKYETGERMPSVKTLIALSACFDTTTDYILGLTDAPKVD